MRSTCEIHGEIHGEIPRTPAQLMQAHFTCEGHATHGSWRFSEMGVSQ